MSNGKLEEFKAYLLARELFDHAVGDMDRYMQSFRLQRPAGRQLAGADSVCANIEEGYGRESIAEYRRFLIIYGCVFVFIEIKNQRGGIRRL